MSQANPMSNLYRRLGEVGLSRAYVRATALPGWWDDEIAANPSGYAQGLLLLSRHLGLELSSLQDEAAPVRLRDFGPCKLKKRPGVAEGEWALARAMATRAAQLAAAAVAGPPGPLPGSPGEVRQHILDRGAPWVGLGELLDYCWAQGLPVLPLDRFPPRARRPDGLAARVEGRPVIVLCRRTKVPARLLFVLAHALGHLALGHIPEGGSLLDERVDEASPDEDEKQANAFARELLTAGGDGRATLAGRWPSAHDLARDCRRAGSERGIDPGFLVLGQARARGRPFFEVARAALGVLEPGADALALVRTRLASHLDWSRLPADSSEFLMRVTRQGRGG